MSETENQATENKEAEEVLEQESESSETPELSPVIWSQKRVPNIEKGYNQSIPFYMMGIFVILIILSLIFAKLTS